MGWMRHPPSPPPPSPRPNNPPLTSFYPRPVSRMLSLPSPGGLFVVAFLACLPIFGNYTHSCLNPRVSHAHISRSACTFPLLSTMDTITVSNLNDSGTGSLRQAIAAANAYTGKRMPDYYRFEMAAGFTTPPMRWSWKRKKPTVNPSAVPLPACKPNAAIAAQNNPMFFPVSQSHWEMGCGG